MKQRQKEKVGRKGGGYETVKCQVLLDTVHIFSSNPHNHKETGIVNSFYR